VSNGSTCASFKKDKGTVVPCRRYHGC
jgi:hypothetical protein